MAVFEKKIRRKVHLDDTQVLSCIFENTQNIQGHTEYIIRIQRGPQPEKSWHIYKRYNDFASLQSSMQISGLDLRFPPKKLIGNMDREFIADRQIALENYLNLILMNPILASSLPVRKFLDPDNYSTPFQELALQHVSMALRSEVNYEVVKPLPEVGWRIRKHYFLIKCHSCPREEKVVSWVEHGPDKYLEDRDLQAIFKSIGNLQHPLIQPIEFLSCNDVGGYAARNLSSLGSLRDLICSSSKPKLQFIKKYGNPKEYKTFPADEIALYGLQILEVLKFLHEKGLPFGHLHTGNILLENKCVKLLDIENGVLGLPSYYRPFFVQHKKLQTLEAVDVYCFGHVLYEMAFGQPLHESVCDNLPASCPSLLRPVLESILSSTACKASLPTLTELMSHPFFSSFNRASSNHLSKFDRPQLKFPTHVKEALKAARQKTENRLREEQKIVRHQKRLVKVQERLSSEGEQRKRKLRQQKQLQQEHQQQQQQQQQLSVNGKSPERSESPASTSTATSAGTVTPPVGISDVSPAPPLPHTPWESPLAPVASVTAPPERSALLGSICNFNKSALRQTTAP